MTLWARSDVLPNGAYGVTISVDDDRAWTLSREQAVGYAVACMQQATAAEHDTAVYRLLRHVGVGEVTAAAVLVHDIRPDRLDDHTATAPLRFHARTSPRGGAFIEIELDAADGRTSTRLGQLSPDELRQHGTAVLDVLAAVDLDAALRRALAGTYGLDEAHARALVGGLARFLPKRDTGNPGAGKSRKRGSR